MIKNRTFIRAPAFVWALLAILLVSSTIGTTVWAGKPAKPGKPLPPEPETFNYQIWVGIGDLNGEGAPEDLVLEPYGGPLVVADVEYSGRWLPPPTKGKKHIAGWSVGLEKSEGDYCGTYDINDASLMDVLNVNGYWPINDKEVFRFNIQHRLTALVMGTPTSERVDSWFILIDFLLGTYGPIPSDPPITMPNLLMLHGETDTGLEPEGEYGETTDTWTVYFNKAWFRVTENTGSGEIEELWTGQLSFTVKITRTLVES